VPTTGTGIWLSRLVVVVVVGGGGGGVAAAECFMI
jgi:hypothetical protein